MMYKGRKIHTIGVIVSIFVVGVATSSCNNSSKPKGDPNSRAIHQALVSGKKFDPYFFDVAEFGSFVTNRTLLFYESQHGTQVEYHSADGKTYLWYPGNSIVLPGVWKVQKNPNLTLSRGGESKPSPEICFKYSEGTINPVTNSSGGEWECRISIAYGTNLQENREGDVFGLSRTSSVPFVLPKAQQTIAGLLQNNN